jgi:hypothetical protein
VDELSRNGHCPTRTITVLATTMLTRITAVTPRIKTLYAFPLYDHPFHVTWTRPTMSPSRPTYTGLSPERAGPRVKDGRTPLLPLHPVLLLPGGKRSSNEAEHIADIRFRAREVSELDTSVVFGPPGLGGQEMLEDDGSSETSSNGISASHGRPRAG